MLLQFFFKRLSAEKQLAYLRKKGIALGTRARNGRKIYIYMLRDLFVEVMYKNDNTQSEPEKLVVMRGLKNLNEYLENEFRASF
jgi:hypothetical protein